MDEDVVKPIGQYTLELEKKPTVTKMAAQLNSSAAVKVTITLPNGTVVDPDVFYWDEWNWWGWEVVGYAVAWYDWEAVDAGLIIGVAGFIIGLFTEGLGNVIDLIDILLGEAEFFKNSYDLMCMYFEVVEWFGFPVYGESGFYTDRIMNPYGGGWIYIGWTFCALSPFNFGWHTSIWPNGWGE